MDFYPICISIFLACPIFPKNNQQIRIICRMCGHLYLGYPNLCVQYSIYQIKNYGGNNSCSYVRLYCCHCFFVFEVSLDERNIFGASYQICVGKFTNLNKHSDFYWHINWICIFACYGTKLFIDR
jgi:hypothetical protein